MKPTRVVLLAVPAALALTSVRSAIAQVPPAFPGAEGFGAGATMRKNNLPFAGEVYHVTSLADTNTQGTLRHAVRESGFPAGGRVVVFDVGGTINLTASLDIKNVNGLYIAGQTAPSPITIYGAMTQLTSSGGKTNQNVIVRNLAFRKGNVNDDDDAITFAGSGLGTNLILDHVSASWAEDENLSVANNNTNVTVQYSMINDALVSNHAYGSLIRPRIDSNVTFHHNLYAHNSSRQARFGTYNSETLTADFRNNVVYNWRDRASYAGGSSESAQEFVDVNYVGNYLIAGPGTLTNASTAFIVDKNVDVRAYQSGNFIDSDKQVNPGGQPNGADTGTGMFAFNPPVTDQTLVYMGSPFATAAVATQSAIDAYNQVINYVGSSWWNRDAIDTRVIGNVQANTGPTIGAAAPNAAELNGVLTAPTVTRPAGWDTDNDGMPNAWETAHGLNPNTANAGADFDSDGYSNIEEYLNEAGAFPAPRPITWTGGAAARYALNDKWDTWQPSRFDAVIVDNGKATVDAVGQHAGNLKIGQAATAGEVEITAGWLDVAAVVDIGKLAPGGTGKLRLTGGSVAIGAGLNLNSTGTLILGGGTLALNVAAPFNWNGGTLQTTVNQGIALNANLAAGSAGTLDTTDKTVTYSGNLAGPGGFIKTGIGTATLTGTNTHTGGTTVQAGTLIVNRLHGLAADGAGTPNPVTITSGTLKIAESSPTIASGHPGGNNAFVSRPGSMISIANDGGDIVSLNPTTLTPRIYNGTLDLTNNDLVIDYDGPSPIADIEDMIRAGRNGGNWLGNGITSSTAGSIAAAGAYTLGVIDNATPGITPFTTFSGQTVDTTTVLVKFVHRSDINMDGVVTFSDSVRFNGNYSEGTPTRWVFGDLNYNGVSDFGDSVLFNGGYDEALTSLPEPGLGAAIVGLAALTLRRRRTVRAR